MATSGNFGPAVVTDNPGAVTGYQWEESATGAGVGFGDVGTIIIDTTDTTLTTLTVNTSTVAMNGTFVRVRADFLDGVTPATAYSNEVQLTVT